MWEMLGKDKKPVVMTMEQNGYMYDERCRLCGQYILEKENFYMIYTPDKYRDIHSNVKRFFLVHAEEWDEFCKDVKTDEELFNKLKKKNQPKKKPFTASQIEKIENFKKAAIFYNFKEEFRQPVGYKMKQRKSSMVLIYNVYYDHIEFDQKSNNGPLSFLFKNQIVANVENYMHKLSGDGKINDYSIRKIIDEAINETNKFMRK